MDLKYTGPVGETRHGPPVIEEREGTYVLLPSDLKEGDTYTEHDGSVWVVTQNRTVIGTFGTMTTVTFAARRAARTERTQR